MTHEKEDEALLTYVPLDPQRTFSEEDSGSLQDLFGCKESGLFFTAVEMKVELEQRSSRSAKQLFCPCCPKSALKIEASGGQTKIHCATCGWDASSIGVSDVSDLLQRDGDPYPWISNEFRTLSRQIEEQRAESELFNQGDDLFAWTSLSENNILRGTSMKRLRGRAQSLVSIERRPKDHELTKQESASRCAQNFARDQEQKEKRIFASWTPPNLRPIPANTKGKPQPELSSLYAGIDLDQLVTPQEQICAATWFKRDCAARRRVPNPRVSFHSPVANHGIGVDSRYIVPRMSVRIVDECKSKGSGTAGVIATITNDTNAAQISVTISNAKQASERVQLSLSQGEQKSVQLKPFTLEHRVAPNVVRLDKMEARLAVLHVELEHSSGEYVGHTWRICIFARHRAVRSDLNVI